MFSIKNSHFLSSIGKEEKNCHIIKKKKFNVEEIPSFLKITVNFLIFSVCLSVDFVFSCVSRISSGREHIFEFKYCDEDLGKISLDMGTFEVRLMFKN